MEQEPIPPFDGNYGNVDLTQDGLNTKARVGSMYSSIAMTWLLKYSR